MGAAARLRHLAGDPSQLDGRLQVDTGSLYPALHRLARQKLIAASWKTSDNRQRIRVYRLTKKGREELVSGRSRWARFVEAMGGILGARQEGEA